MENYGPTNTNATTANRHDFGPTSWEEMNDEEKKKRATGICCYNLLGLVSTAAFICGYVPSISRGYCTNYIRSAPPSLVVVYCIVCRARLIPAVFLSIVLSFFLLF